MAVLSNPYQKAAAVTPADGSDLPGGVCRAVYIGGAGNLSVILGDDSSPVTLTGLLVGTVYPICAKRIRSTSTTATNIVALY